MSIFEQLRLYNVLRAQKHHTVNCCVLYARETASPQIQSCTCSKYSIGAAVAMHIKIPPSNQWILHNILQNLRALDSKP